MSGGVDSSVAAHLLTEAGARGDRRLHAPRRAVAGGVRGCERAEPGRRARPPAGSAARGRRCPSSIGSITSRAAAPPPTPRTPAAWPIARHSVLRPESRSRSSARSSTTSSTSTRPAARRTPACSATTGSSSASCSTMPTASGRSSSPRGTTPGWNTTPTATPRSLRGVDAAKDQSYVLFGIRPRVSAADDAAGGRIREAGDSADGRRLGTARRREEGQPGNLLRHAGPVRRIRPAPASATIGDTRAARSSRPTAPWSASIAGIEGFTVGQRKGLGVALGERKFVVRIEPETRRVVIGDRDELYLREFTARGTNWLVSEYCVAALLRPDPLQRRGASSDDDRAAGPPRPIRVRRTAVCDHARASCGVYDATE